MESYNRDSVYILYSNFTDRNGTPVDPESMSASIHYVNETVNYPLVEDLTMERLQTGLYYAKYQIPEDAKYGTYLSIIECTIGGIDSRGTETFVVGDPSGSAGSSLISVVGKLQDDDNVPLDSAEISATEGNEEVARTRSDNDGKWGLRLSPGEYTLHISRNGYLARMLEIVVPSNQSWYNLDIIELKTKTATIDQGDGTRKVTDKITGPDGKSMVNVRVRAYAADNEGEIIAQDYTDEDGRWVLYLDPARYRIKFYKYGYSVPDPLTWDVD